MALKISSSKVVQFSNENRILKVPDLAKEGNHVVFAQCDAQPLSPQNPYFRVKVVQQAKDAVVAIGLSNFTTDLDAEDIENDETDFSSRRSDAVAYFSDDGSVSSPASKGSKEFLPTFGQGDVVGLCIDYFTPTKSLVCIYKNDKLVQRRWLSLKPEFLFPTINVWWGTVELHVDWLSSSPPSCSQDNVSDWNMPDTVTTDDNLVSLRTSSEIAAIQAPYPFHTSAEQYLEMTIVAMEEDTVIGPVIGVTSALLDDGKLPGTMMEAIGYSAADGTIYYEHPINATPLGDNCKCGTGDVMGCGLVFSNPNEADKRKSVKVIIYFTKNGKVVHHHAISQPMGGFYPTIGLAFQGCIVKMNTQCSAPPLPDVEDWRVQSKKFQGFGLGFSSAEINRSTGPTFKDGTTSGDFRFSELLEVPSGDVIRPTKSGSSKQLLQLLKMMTPEQRYFTITVTEDDPKGKVSIGITRDKQSVGELPGDLVDTVGFSSSGKISNGEEKHSTEKYVKGDEVGCFVEYFDRNLKIVHFIKNGQLVGVAPMTGGSADMFPSLGFSGEQCAVRVNWPSPSLTLSSTFSQNDLSNWIKCSGLILRGSSLTVQKKKRNQHAMSFKSPQPLTKAWDYFQVAVNSTMLSTLNQHISKAPVIGLTNVLGNKPFKELSNGDKARDIRYYCNTNCIGYKDALSNEKSKLQILIESGDRLGFGIVYPPKKNQPDDRASQVVVVYCTIGDTLLYHRAMEQPAGGFYPIISLYKFGSEVQIDTNPQPFPLGDVSSWMAEAEQLRKDIIQAKKDEAGYHRMSTEERQENPASPAEERPQNHLNKYKILIYYDSARYNGATHIQAQLEEKGFVAILPPISTLEKEIMASIKTCDSLVCCMGPEISNSQLAGKVLDLAKESGKPILPCILTSVNWPPEGAAQEHFHMLTMDKIEMTQDFDWGVDQIAEKTLDLKGKGYNGKVIKVEIGEGAKKLYTDAQKGNQTTNKESDPNALKKAVIDADNRKATSFGNTPSSNSPPPVLVSDRPHSVTPRGKTDRVTSGRPRSQSASGGPQGGAGQASGLQKSKMCLIL
ncbi:uncharacterized protein LOC117300133 [Asterias rubens]|uniref:uncharacterized protein LOC117300133 n=1 Tax=Asterias rubens TaxID=7604 RepID=UPI00145503E7|nr:uncharacterized protein LOC117300133 [Asterias rubens]XP_033639748.1 uncharacterized protein LOC117300133 [Asterias rubens]